MSSQKPTHHTTIPPPGGKEDLGPEDHEPIERPLAASGAVKFDERGNAVWQWSIDTGAFGANASAERMRRLDNPTLSIAPDQPTPFNGVKYNPLGTKKGYDPYDSGKLGKHNQPPRKKDLRKLSEWLKLKKQATSKKDED